MRKLIIGGVALAACSGAASKADTATVRDSTVVAGPVATVTPAVDSATPAPTSTAAKSVSRTTAGTKPQSSAKVEGAVVIDVPVDSLRLAPSDSIRGVVSVTGTSFEKHVMVVAGNRRVEITGALAATIGRLAGIDVSVSGNPRGSAMDASRFTVRTVEGQPAIDGTLRAEGGSLYIVTADGARTRITNPPPPLQGRTGARVWITGDPTKGVASFGFIDPAR